MRWYVVVRGRVGAKLVTVRVFSKPCMGYLRNGPDKWRLEYPSVDYLEEGTGEPVRRVGVLGRGGSTVVAMPIILIPALNFEIHLENGKWEMTSAQRIHGTHLEFEYAG